MKSNKDEDLRLLRLASIDDRTLKIAVIFQETGGQERMIIPTQDLVTALEIVLKAKSPSHRKGRVYARKSPFSKWTLIA